MIRVIGVFLMVVSAASAWGNPVLSWEQCIEETKQHNPELGSARQKLESAGYLKGTAAGNYYPQISASTKRTDTGTRSYTAGVTASQNIFSGFRDKSKVRQAKANISVAEEDLAITEAKIAADLKSAFQNVKYAQDYIKLTREIMERRKKNLMLVELKFESGRENKGSVLLAEALLKQAELDHIEAKNLVKTTRQQLIKILGREATESDTLQVTGDIPLKVPDENAPVQTLALKTPERKKAMAQEESARAAVEIAKAGFFPSVDITGEIDRQGDRFFPEEENHAVGINMSVPIFNGGRDYYNTKSEKALLSAAILNRQNTDRDLVVKLRQALAAFMEAAEKLQVDRTFLEAAETRAKIGKEKYNNGLLSFEDWNDIENDRITRAKNLLQSARDRVTKEAAWNQALGKGI